MPIRHSAHHGISFAFSILASVVLSEVFRPLVPGVLKIFDNAASNLINLANLHMDYKIVSILLVALIIAVVYGFVYGLVERRRI